MNRLLLTLPFLAAALPGLAACGESRPAGDGNMTMRDMEVVDGTANDSMADLDNAVTDGTAMANVAGPLPTGSSGTDGAAVGNRSSAPVTNDSRVSGTTAGNSAAAE